MLVMTDDMFIYAFLSLEKMKAYKLIIILAFF